MKQVLIYLVEFLKEHHEMSMSEMSKGLGRSRNFIQQAIARGYDNDDKYKSLIADLRYNFFVNGDYTDFLKFMENKHQEEIHKTEMAGDEIIDHLHERVESYQVALKQSLESNLEEIEKKNKTIADLEHRIVVLSRDVDKGWEEVNKLNEVVATKDLFIDGQDEELKEANKNNDILRGCIDRKEDVIEGLMSRHKVLIGEICDHEKSLEALAKAGHSTGASLRNAETKNRILTGALIGVGLLWAVSAWVMNRKCMPHSELVSCVASDCPNNHEIVIKKIEEARAEYDYYDCIVSTPIPAILGYDGRVSYGFNFRRNYTNIYNADCKADQSEIVENRQIELGLRPDPVKAMEREHQRVRDEIEWNRKYHENYRKLFSREKQKTTNNSPKIILVVIIISLILLFAFLK